MKMLDIQYEENPFDLDFQEIASAVMTVLNQKENITVELSFVSEEEIQKINRDFRGVDKVTDVLSFPSLEDIRGKILKKEDFPCDIDFSSGDIFLGSIAICIKKVKEQALEFGHSEKRECAYLLTHGILHLFGYDHMIDSDKKQMREEEEKIMTMVKLTREENI